MFSDPLDQFQLDVEYKASLGKGDSSLFKDRALFQDKGRNQPAGIIIGLLKFVYCVEMFLG